MSNHRRSHAITNGDLVRNLVANGIIKCPTVKQAMLDVDRANYCIRGSQDPASAYYDSPQGIGHNVTISAPHMHAHALEQLEAHLRPGMSALDVGSGSGYLTACMAMMVCKTEVGYGDGERIRGLVVGIDHVPELVEWSKDNLIKDGKERLMSSGRLSMVVGDGRQGYAKGAPYDAIHVGAAARKLHSKLIEQLKPGGRMVIPVGPRGMGSQNFEVVDKALDGTITRTKLFGVRYVPLTSKEKQYTKY